MWVRSWGSRGRSLFLLLGTKRGRHEVFIVEAIPLTLRLEGQEIRDIAEADESTLVCHLLLHLNVHALVEGTLSSKMVEVNLRLLVADSVTTLALFCESLLNLRKLGTLDEVLKVAKHLFYLVSFKSFIYNREDLKFNGLLSSTSSILHINSHPNYLLKNKI